MTMKEILYTYYIHIWDDDDSFIKNNLSDEADDMDEKTHFAIKPTKTMRMRMRKFYKMTKIYIYLPRN